MPAPEPCTLLAWDSDFFARRIARVSAGVLTPDALLAIEQQAVRDRIECLYLLTGAGQSETTRLAQASGFRLVDVRVTLDVPIPSAHALDDASLRIGTSSDAAALRAIAKVSHRDSRFYQDGGFPEERCDALYEAWIDNSFQGWADVVFVALRDAEPVGYVSCSQRDGSGQIGLLGVAAHAHGQGHGARLVRRALAWFSERGCARATVVTQGQNLAAQRLYQKCGFSTSNVELWFHRWFARPGD